MIQRNLAIIIFAVLFSALLGAWTAYLPLVTAQTSAVQRRLYRAPAGYALVGGDTGFIACGPDGRLRLSLYAKRPDGSEGGTVFVVTNGGLVEDQRLRGLPGRGSLSGVDPARCSLGDRIVFAGWLDPETFLLLVGD